MVKEKRILSYFIGWLIIGFCILFVGVNNVFAATYTPVNYKAQLYDNINGSLSAVETTLENNDYYYGFIGLTAYTSGGAWGISSPIPLLANHTYSMTVDPFAVGCGYTILSTVNRIGVGTSLSNAVTSYQNNTNVTEKFSQAVSNSRYLQYVFTPSINASYIVFPYATTSTCSSTTNQLSNVVIEDLGESGVSQDQINTSLNNQTTEIQSSIDNSTNTITGAIGETENNINSNIDDMEDAILESNKETQEVIKDQFNSCRDGYNLLQYSTTTDTTINGIDFKFNSDGTITANGTATANTRFDFVTSSSITLSSGQYTFSGSSGGSLNTYWMETIVAPNNIYFHSINGPETISLADGSYIFKAYIYIKSGFTVNNITFKPMFEKGSIAHTFEPYTSDQICTNKIDDTNDKLDETNDKLDNLQDSITDSSSPDTSGLTDSAGWLPPGPLDSVLNLPLSLFNALTTNLNKSCNPINIPLPYVNKNITLPCINTLYNQIGITSFLSWIGVIVSGLMLYTYLLKLYKWIEDRVSLNETHNVDSWGGL